MALPQAVFTRRLSIGYSILAEIANCLDRPLSNHSRSPPLPQHNHASVLQFGSLTTQIGQASGSINYIAGCLTPTCGPLAQLRLLRWSANISDELLLLRLTGEGRRTANSNFLVWLIYSSDSFLTNDIHRWLTG